MQTILNPFLFLLLSIILNVINFAIRRLNETLSTMKNRGSLQFVQIYNFIYFFLFDVIGNRYSSAISCYQIFTILVKKSTKNHSLSREIKINKSNLI